MEEIEMNKKGSNFNLALTLVVPHPVTVKWSPSDCPPIVSKETGATYVSNENVPSNCKWKKLKSEEQLFNKKTFQIWISKKSEKNP